MQYNSLDELLAALARMLTDPDADDKSNDPTFKRLLALYDAYMDALEEAEQYGWIGVGCITFAENRLRSLSTMTIIKDLDPRGFDEYGNYGENNPPLDREY